MKKNTIFGLAFIGAVVSYSIFVLAASDNNWWLAAVCFAIYAPFALICISLFSKQSSRADYLQNEVKFLQDLRENHEAQIANYIKIVQASDELLDGQQQLIQDMNDSIKGHEKMQSILEEQVDILNALLQLEKNRNAKAEPETSEPR